MGKITVKKGNKTYRGTNGKDTIEKKKVICSLCSDNVDSRADLRLSLHNDGPDILQKPGRCLHAPVQQGPHNSCKLRAGSQDPVLHEMVLEFLQNRCDLHNIQTYRNHPGFLCLLQNEIQG